MIALKEYQNRSLEVLECYFRRVVELGGRDDAARQAFLEETNRPYIPVGQLPELPYVCLRVPTGGGKTLMACHALGIAAQSFLQAERAVCLWLVPSNTIRGQTLTALKDRQHPYRQALDSRFSGQVRVMDLEEALYVQRGVIEGETLVIVSTFQALRVEDTEGRKVYEPAGALQHHFSGLPPALEGVLEMREDGSVIYSLANVLRLWRPFVIMDEAHNARTPLSFETLARFRPSAIVEFTATPQTTGVSASNVLCHVSAAELKSEEMVKLPIYLRTRGEWKEVVADAIQTQNAIEQTALAEAAETSEHIRPIVLLQAQPRSQERPTLTVDVVKQSLTDDFKIPADQIAIATGQKWELDGVNLFSRDCPIRFIITVQALREGWDCSFAYVLCSVAEIGSSRAVEQLLGRILRLPNARRKQRPELNCAYAFVASPRFIEAASALEDALIENGFQRLEAKDLVVPAQDAGLQLEPGTLFVQTSLKVSEPPNFTQLDEEIRKKVSYEDSSGQLTVTGALTLEELHAIQKSFAKPEDQAAIENIVHSQGKVGTLPFILMHEKRPPFRVPWLAIREDGQLEIFEKSHVQDYEWRLADCDSTLSEAEFPSKGPAGEAGVIDVSERGRIEVLPFVNQLQAQLMLLDTEQGWSEESLVNWLDRQIPHKDIPLSQSVAFLGKAVRGLIEKRGTTVEQLAREKFRLRKSLEEKIAQHRIAESRKSYDRLLFGADSARIEVNREHFFEFQEDRYAPNWFYDGNYRWSKHYFTKVGELEAQGEEFHCAVYLDSHPKVWFWVRNPARGEHSFWLQTATDRFYPDFVVLLHDGRILAVEYKGEPYWSNDDSREKRRLGKLWAERSNGWCLFAMPKGANWSEIDALLHSPSPFTHIGKGSLFE